MHGAGRFVVFSFFFTDTATPEIYTLSLHDALPISSLSWCTAKAEAGERSASRLATESLCTRDRKSTRLNSSHVEISYAVFCLKKKKHGTALPIMQPSQPVSSTPGAATVGGATPAAH